MSLEPVAMWLVGGGRRPTLLAEWW